MSILIKDIDIIIINFCYLNDYRNIICVNKYYYNVIINNPLYLEFKRYKTLRLPHITKDNQFVYSCLRGFIFYIKYLVSRYKINIHINKDIAFQLSCRHGHIKIAKYLIELGNQSDHGQINIHTNYDYAFKCACVYRHVEIANYLIELGNCPNMTPIPNELIKKYSNMINFSNHRIITNKNSNMETFND